ncbi:MAG: helix-turn-helix domain-containing protein [Flavobacteriales bacterium]|nr:helix-turn-helix domain-containing protein [Flavobacteriales bacterium]
MKYIRREKAIKLIGKKIRDIRKTQKITQAQLAFEAGIPRNQVVNIELGKVNTSISSIIAIAEILDIHPKELFDIDFSENKKSK